MSDHKQDEHKHWKKDLIEILKSKRVRQVGLILLALVAVRLGINWWIERNSGETEHVVKTAELSLRSVDKSLSLPGNIEAIEQATLYAHVSGYLKQIKVDEGDHVKKNQLLAVIDAPDVVQEFRNAKAEFDFKETTRKRFEALLSEAVVSQQEYDKVEADANQAKARFDNANANLEYTYVRAPFEGSIARRFKYPGDFISAPTKGGAPTPLFMLVNEDRLRIVINAPQKELGSIQAGQAVDIRVDTFPNEKFSGTVSRVDALLDEATKTQRALVDIDNPEKGPRLRAGMFAAVVMHVQRKDNVLMISKDAVHEDGDKAFVFIVKEGHAKKIAVTLGDSESGFIEVNSPVLDRADHVVVSGGASIVDGDPVVVAGDAKAATPEVPKAEEQKKSDEPKKGEESPREVAEKTKR